mmetsp:Transcript_8441/g.15379  ORF Transcript_8441/g.15379 Transcript_8441/m.15379 type:complete len:96 (+) Transcript_8441:1187-1474(+)
MIDIRGIDLEQEEDDSDAGDGTDDEQHDNVGILEEGNQTSREDDDRSSGMIAHFVIGDLSRHTIASHDALRDGVETGGDQGRYCSLDEFDDDHPS